MRIETVLEVAHIHTSTSYGPDGQEVRVGEINLEDSATGLGANAFFASQSDDQFRLAKLRGIEVFVKSQEAARFRVGQKVRVILEVLDDQADLGINDTLRPGG